MARGVRAARATTLIGRVDSGNYDAIRFVRANDDVHVLAAAGDRPQQHRELFGDGVGESMVRMLLGEVWTICGTRFARHRGGFEQGAQLVSHFPDEQLCPRCHAAFGDRAVLIFEANQDDGRDPTQIGRLDDLVTRGQQSIE